MGRPDVVEVHYNVCTYKTLRIRVETAYFADRRGCRVVIPYFKNKPGFQHRFVSFKSRWKPREEADAEILKWLRSLGHKVGSLDEIAIMQIHPPSEAPASIRHLGEWKPI